MVAIAPREAERFLAKPPEGVRLFLVYGSDPGAITERARRLESLALKRGGGEAAIRFGSDEVSDDPGRVADEAYAASLFGGEPVLSIRILDGRHNVIGALQPILDRPPEAAWIVVEAGDLSKTSPLRKAFEDSPDAAALPTYALEGGALTSFIHAAAAEAGVTIGGEALQALAEALAGDRLASRGELEKLFLYVGKGEVTVADVEAIVGETTEARTDEIIDAALLGNHEALETGMNRLAAEGGSASGLATLTLRHLFTLQGLRAAVDAGTTVEGVLARARPPIHFRRKAQIEAELKRWSDEGLRMARRLIDQAIYLTRLQPGLDPIAISEALHQVALLARRLKNAAP
jgi:DNA polymerase III subunit delta